MTVTDTATEAAPKPRLKLRYQSEIKDALQKEFGIANVMQIPGVTKVESVPSLRGRIVESKATRGSDVLAKVLDTDEGARRLGEVALVPHSSPISKSGILFYNTLFDENASCHIALGQCYSKCFLDGASLSPEQIRAQGGNESLIHIDWMIGSDKVDIDGIRADGSRTPVMRAGEWA